MPTALSLRSIVLVATVAATGLTSQHLQSTEVDSTAAAAAATVDAFHAAMKAGDVSGVMKRLSPDVVILEQGARESRDEYRNHHLADDIKFAMAVATRREQVQVQVSGDVAWVSSTSVTQGAFQGNPVNLSGVELMVLLKNEEGWLIRAIHWSSRRRK